MDIVTTIGPASESPDVIGRFLKCGVKCIRFPFSKATPAIHGERCARVKRVATELGLSVEAMVDLPGGKPRLSNAEPLLLEPKRKYMIDVGGAVGQEAELSVNPALSGAVLSRARVFGIGDGENHFYVESVRNGVATGTFAESGTLERQRAFVPLNEDLRFDVLTDVDRVSLRRARQASFDSVALSFVESASDIDGAREWLEAELSWKPQIVAKVETRRGVENVQEIGRVADKVLIGRGDLAMQMKLGELWHAQRTVLDVCRGMGRYAIVGTEFLESLMRRPFPTRPEIMDICCALEMGASAILLTVETAIGPRPTETVELLKEIEVTWRKSGASWERIVALR